MKGYSDGECLNELSFYMNIKDCTIHLSYDEIEVLCNFQTERITVILMYVSSTLTPLQTFFLVVRLYIFRLLRLTSVFVISQNRVCCDSTHDLFGLFACS